MITHALALTLLVAVLVAWVGVQAAWRRTFASTCSDPDVLAAREGCGHCKSSETCDRRRPDRSGSCEEGIS